ncbi:MAG: hypothetical protein Fur007_07230 [Rhodoferax sp.]
MSPLIRHALLAVGISCAFNVCAAPDPVARVKTVQGDAWVITGSARVKAEPGTPVFEGSQLKTGSPGSLGISFKDDTLMSFGPDTELVVDQYLYAPGQGRLKLGTRLTKGSMNYLSGMIAKLKPDTVSVTTPTGTIGVRGTHFAVKVVPE